MAYLKTHLYNFLPDHAIDIQLRGIRRCDMIKHEALLFIVGLDDQLILLGCEVHAFWVAGLGVVGLETDDHFYLLFAV